MRMTVIVMTMMRMTETLSGESSFRACFNQFAESCNKQEQSEFLKICFGIGLIQRIS